MKKLLLILLASSFLYSMDPDVDAYTEYKYKYLLNGVQIDAHNIIKYEFGKNKYGFKDILLFSLRGISNEMKKNGYKKFILFLNNEKKIKNSTIETILKNYNPSSSILAYNYAIGKKKSNFTFSSLLSLVGNIALIATGISNPNNIDMLGHGLDGVMSGKKGNLINDTFNRLENTHERKLFKNKLFFDSSNLSTMGMASLTNIKGYRYMTILTVKEVDEYFKDKNKFRIKELNKTKKHYIERGLK